jgi:hypothetical protein
VTNYIDEEQNDRDTPSLAPISDWSEGLDRDRDGINDLAELAMAEHFAPFITYDSNDTAPKYFSERSEPLVLFQVQPMPKVWQAPYPYELYNLDWDPHVEVIRIVYILIWTKDTGYSHAGCNGSGEVSCNDAHNGDMLRIVVSIVSPGSMTSDPLHCDGDCAVAEHLDWYPLFVKAWKYGSEFDCFSSHTPLADVIPDKHYSMQADDVFLNSGVHRIETCMDRFPAGDGFTDCPNSGFHPVVILSAGKRHPYIGSQFNGAQCVSNSAYTEWICDDDIDQDYHKDGNLGHHVVVVDSCEKTLGNNVGEMDPNFSRHTQLPIDEGSEEDVAYHPDSFVKNLSECGWEDYEVWGVDDYRGVDDLKLVHRWKRIGDTTTIRKPGDATDWP